jgi:DNA polymerase III subunit alpha
MNNYTVYHLHSDMSNGVTNIDSVTKYSDYIKYAASLGMKALAFSEHGSVFQWVKKKMEIENAGMKYIHAEEFYVTERIFDDEGKKVRDNLHCVLIAKNYAGVLELNTLSSKAFNREDGHFYYTPRITLDELFGTSENIIVTTACLGGILAKANDNVKKQVLKFLAQNKERCYLEVQHHIDECQTRYNKLLANISSQYGIPLIAGTDTHALNDDHLTGRQILQKAKGVFFEEEDNFDLIFKSYNELVQCYKNQGALTEEEYMQAIENTNAMADKIETFELDFSHKYPKLYDDSLAVFKKKIIEGIKKRGINKKPNFQEYKDRINYELNTYIHNDAIDFMLLEEDYKTALRNEGVSYGYSRGSVSGSIIAYLLYITDVDSIKYNLNFERFMNPERISLADIDTDWFKGDRWKVRDYLFKRDKLYCCDIITFNTIALKGAIKDIGRALSLSIEEAQTISDAVYQDENKKDTIDESYINKYPELFKYVNLVKGTIVSVGNHPAALVVSPFDVNSAFGTFYTSTDENPVSQINMKAIDALNYVKLDVLGLDCVGLINETCDFANIPRLTPDNMDFTDMNVWNSLKENNTLCFQFESDFAGDYLKNILKDDTINKIKVSNPNFSYIDLMSMANGAIRPAGASYRDELSQGIYRDNGHPALNEFLTPTLGYLVYQEQIIEFLYKFCGFTMGEADIVRRHFSKKTGTETDIPIIKDGGYLNKNHYIKGFVATMKEKYNTPEEESEKLIVNFLKVIIDASDYLFSKNHADPYSFLGFACAYLRHYHLLEFLTAAMNIYKEDSEKSTKIKVYAKSKNIEVKSIKFGHSRSEYYMDKENNCIYQGIEAIKYCNAQIADELMELSKNKYSSFIDLLADINAKTSVNSRQLTILTGLNFFSDFGKNKYLLNMIDIYNKFNGKKQIKKTDLFKFGLTFEQMQKYSQKETEALFKEIDIRGLIDELCKSLDNKELSIQEMVEFEMTYLEYTTYSNPKVNENFFICTEFKIYKDKTKPYLVIRRIKTGEEIKTKITKGKAFSENPFKCFSVIKVDNFKEQNKKKCVNGEWVETDEKERIITDWTVIKD